MIEWRNLSRPTAALLLERLTRLVSSALLTVIVARHLGAGSLGLFAIVMAWASFLIPLSSLGLNNLVVRQLTRCKHEDEAIATLYTALLLRLMVGGIAALAVVYLFYRIEPMDTRAVPLASVATLFLLQTFYSFILLEFVLHHQGQFHQVAWWKIAVTVAGLVLKLLLLWLGLGIASLIVVAGLELAAVAAVQHVQFRRLHRPLIDGATVWPLPGIGWFSLAQARQLLRRSSWLWASAIVSVLYLKVDVLMIGALAGSEQAGLYAAASRLSELWYVFPATLATRYYPTLLERYRQSNTAYLLTIRRHAAAYCLAGTGVAIAMSIAAPAVVTLLFGPAFSPAVSVLQIHVWAGCFVFVQYLVHQHLIISGQEPLTLLSHGGGALINLLLNLWLIPRMGIDGAAWATLVAYAFTAVFFALFSARLRAQGRALLRVRAQDYRDGRT